MYIYIYIHIEIKLSKRNIISQISKSAFHLLDGRRRDGDSPPLEADRNWGAG